jgi:hypothetical protein
VSFLTPVLNVVQGCLELALVALLARGFFRKYIAFSVYVLAALGADLAENITYYAHGWKSQIYRQFYWTDHIALDLLLFLVVIAFTYKALGGNGSRRKAAKVLAGIGAAAIILPFALLRYHHGKHHGHFDSQWFNHTSQILNFGAALMNLALWTALLSNRKRDPKLVTLSIGLGLVTSSAAIAWGARQWLPEQDRWPIDTLVTLIYIASLLLWCWVFKPRQERRLSKPLPPAAAPDALTTPS